MVNLNFNIIINRTWNHKEQRKTKVQNPKPKPKEERTKPQQAPQTHRPSSRRPIWQEHK